MRARPARSNGRNPVARPRDLAASPSPTLLPRRLDGSAARREPNATPDLPSGRPGTPPADGLQGHRLPLQRPARCGSRWAAGARDWEGLPCVTATPPRCVTWPSARRMRRRSAQGGDVQQEAPEVLGLALEHVRREAAGLPPVGHVRFPPPSDPSGGRTGQPGRGVGRILPPGPRVGERPRGRDLAVGCAWWNGGDWNPLGWCPWPSPENATTPGVRTG
jgi:hypothetical protein